MTAPKRKCERCGRRRARGHATIDGVRYCDKPCFNDALREMPLGVMHHVVWTGTMGRGRLRRVLPGGASEDIPSLDVPIP